MVAPGGPGITQLHESLHSNCCGRLCVDNGEGTGEPAGPELELSAQVDFMNLPVTGIKVMQAETDTNPEQGDNDYQVPDATCQTLQQGAAPNTFHRHDPNKQEYYIAATDPSVMKQRRRKGYIGRVFSGTCKHSTTRSLLYVFSNQRWL